MTKGLLKRWPIMIRDDGGGSGGGGEGSGRAVELVGRPVFDKTNLTGRFSKKYTGPHAGHAEDYALMLRVSGIYGGVIGGTMVLSRPIAEFMLRQWNFEHKWVLVAVLTGVLGWPLFPVVQRIVRGSRREALRSAYLKARHCPSCDYDLSTLPAGAGELTVCPECGARWWVGEVDGPQA